MEILCPRCRAPSRVTTPAGVSICSACHATLAWPVRFAKTTDADLHAQIRQAASQYHVMRWTLPCLLDEPRWGPVFTRVCWVLEIDVETSTATECDDCSGRGRVTCPYCGATKKAACSGCSGSGQVEGKRGLKQCPTCRGKGERTCRSCQKGEVACLACSGSGRGPARIGQTTRKISRVVSDVPADATWRAAFHDWRDFDAAQYVSHLPNLELIADTGRQDGPIGPLPPNLAIASKPGERVVGARVQQLRACEASVMLRTRRGAVDLRFAGQPLRLLRADLSVLRQRLVLASIAVVLAGCFAVWLMVRYLSRSEWFWAHGHPFALFLSLALVLLGVWTGVLAATLTRRSLVHRHGPPLALGLGAVGVLVAWLSASPSLAAAELALEQGDLRRASAELDALIELDPGMDGVAELREQLDDARGRAADDEREADMARSGIERDATLLRKPWHDAERRQAALDAHLVALRTLIEDAWTRQDGVAMERARNSAWDLSDALEQEAKALSKLIDVRAAITKPDLTLAVERFAEVADLDAVRVRRETVRAELIAALADAARAQCKPGQDGGWSTGTRISALEQCKRLEAEHRKLAERDLEGVDVGKLDARLASERKQLEAEQAAEQRRQETLERQRKQAARREQSKKSSSSSKSSTSGHSSRWDDDGGGGGCCKYCSSGQPCGDSCIAANKTCHKPRGCAC